MTSDPLRKEYVAMAAYCARAERSPKQVRDKLIKKDLTFSQQDEIIGQLIKENFLNQDRFADAFVKDKSRLNKWGVRKITQWLKYHEISDDVIQKSISALDQSDVFAMLFDLLSKKKSSIKSSSELDLKAKLYRFAAQRGYASEQIQRALVQLFKK